jgi:Tfp pilus assembly protein PilN
MIKINLKPNVQSSQALVGGIDLAKLNIRMIVISVLFTGIVPWGVGSYLEGTRATFTQKIEKIEKEKKEYQVKLAELAEVEEKLKKMAEEEKSIQARIDILQDLLKVKSNPMKILHYIAKSIPGNLWITSLDLAGKTLKITGNALDFTNIGKFEAALKESIFFDQDVKLDDYQTKEGKENGVKLVQFSIIAGIVRFE